jgi:hypothetical protein
MMAPAELLYSCRKRMACLIALFARRAIAFNDDDGLPDR